MKKITSMCTKALAVSCCQQAQALSLGSELCHMQMLSSYRSKNNCTNMLGDITKIAVDEVIY
jgi:hypothetical protein